VKNRSTEHLTAGWGRFHLFYVDQLITITTLSVLVQREMECGRSPLASIARASAGKRKQRTETATGFKRRLGRATVGTRGAPDTEFVALRQGLDGRGPYSKRKPTG